MFSNRSRKRFEFLLDMIRKPEHRDETHPILKEKISTDIFISNLRQTIIWTSQIISDIKDTTSINYCRVLRTTNPLYNQKPFYAFTDSIYASTPEIGFDYKNVLKGAFSLRKAAFSDIILKKGNVLAFEMDVTTHDGAPVAESHGFVDESDIPPIDTWFYIGNKYLFCWIPEMFIEKMQSAIDVEILDSYAWIKDAHPELQSLVEREINLL